MMLNWLSRPKIGLALSGGGPKGVAHIGVIKVLEKYHIPIDYIAGTSAGSIAGAFYAAKKDVKSMESYVMKKNWFQLLSIFLDPSFRQGVLKGRQLNNFLKEYLGENITFDNLKIPFSAVSVDINKPSLVKLKKGLVIPAVLASCGAPLLFTPCKCDDQILVDGGLISPVPVEEVREMGADIVIAVDLYKLSKIKKDKFNPISIAKRSVDITLEHLAVHDNLKADVVVQPNIADMNWGELLKVKERQTTIYEGEKAMEEAIPQLITIINSKSFMKLVTNVFIKLKITINKFFTH